MDNKLEEKISVRNKIQLFEQKASANAAQNVTNKPSLQRTKSFVNLKRNKNYLLTDLQGIEQLEKKVYLLEIRVNEYEAYDKEVHVQLQTECFDLLVSLAKIDKHNANDSIKTNKLINNALSLLNKLNTVLPNYEQKKVLQENGVPTKEEKLFVSSVKEARGIFEERPKDVDDAKKDEKQTSNDSGVKCVSVVKEARGVFEKHSNDTTDSRKEEKQVKTDSSFSASSNSSVMSIMKVFQKSEPEKKLKETNNDARVKDKEGVVSNGNANQIDSDNEENGNDEGILGSVSRLSKLFEKIANKEEKPTQKINQSLNDIPSICSTNRSTYRSYIPSYIKNDKNKSKSLDDLDVDSDTYYSSSEDDEDIFHDNNDNLSVENSTKCQYSNEENYPSENGNGDGEIETEDIFDAAPSYEEQNDSNNQNNYPSTEEPTNDSNNNNMENYPSQEEVEELQSTDSQKPDSFAKESTICDDVNTDEAKVNLLTNKEDRDIDERKDDDTHYMIKDEHVVYQTGDLLSMEKSVINEEAISKGENGIINGELDGVEVNQVLRNESNDTNEVQEDTASSDQKKNAQDNSPDKRHGDNKHGIIDFDKENDALDNNSINYVITEDNDIEANHNTCGTVGTEYQNEDSETSSTFDETEKGELDDPLNAPSNIEKVTDRDGLLDSINTNITETEIIPDEITNENSSFEIEDFDNLVDDIESNVIDKLANKFDCLVDTVDNSENVTSSNIKKESFSDDDTVSSQETVVHANLEIKNQSDSDTDYYDAENGNLLDSVEVSNQNDEESKNEVEHLKDDSRENIPEIVVDETGDASDSSEEYNYDKVTENNVDDFIPERNQVTENNIIEDESDDQYGGDNEEKTMNQETNSSIEENGGKSLEYDHEEGDENNVKDTLVSQYNGSEDGSKIYSEDTQAPKKLEGGDIDIEPTRAEIVLLENKFRTRENFRKDKINRNCEDDAQNICMLRSNSECNSDYDGF